MNLLIDAYWVAHRKQINFDMLLNTGWPFYGIDTANHASLFISLHMGNLCFGSTIVLVHVIVWRPFVRHIGVISSVKMK